MHKALDLFIFWASRVLAALGGATLVAMMLLACANMTLRAFSTPVKGTYELMGFLGAVVAAFSLGYSQVSGGHISVNIFQGKLPAGVERVIDILAKALSAAFFFLAARQVDDLARFLMDTGELSETLGIIYYPFTFAVALGCLAMGLILTAELVKLLIPAKEQSA